MGRTFNNVRMRVIDIDTAPCVHHMIMRLIATAPVPPNNRCNTMEPSGGHQLAIDWSWNCAWRTTPSTCRQVTCHLLAPTAPTVQCFRWILLLINEFASTIGPSLCVTNLAALDQCWCANQCSHQRQFRILMLAVNLRWNSSLWSHDALANGWLTEARCFNDHFSALYWLTSLQSG